MSCMNDWLIKIISSKVKIEDLDNLIDPKDKLTSKIFMKKTDALVSDHESKFML